MGHAATVVPIRVMNSRRLIMTPKDTGAYLLNLFTCRGVCPLWVTRVHLARLAIWHTAWLLDQGHRASNESSMSKVICSEAIARVADRSLQILGGMGITRDTVVERIFRDTRAFRIYDGPSEVHRWALGARIVGGKM